MKTKWHKPQKLVGVSISYMKDGKYQTSNTIIINENDIPEGGIPVLVGDKK
jgi:hypothetical protein